MARQARQLTTSVTIYTDGSDELVKQIKEGAVADFQLDARSIKQLIKGPNNAQVQIEFQDGGNVTEGFLVHKPKTELYGPLAQQLALELTEMGDIKTFSSAYKTSVKSVFAAGDCGSVAKVVSNALAMGSMTAAGISAQVQADSNRGKWTPEEN